MTNKEYYTEEGCYILEYQNDETQPDHSVARARVEQGKSTALHLLKKSREQYIILKGAGIAEINRRETEVLLPGDTIDIPPGISQRIKNIGDGDLIFLCVCFPRFTPDQYVQIEYSGNEQTEK